MDIKHKIVSFDSTNGSISVHYFCDDFPEGYIYNIDLPIINNKYPNELEIASLIELTKPVEQIKRIIAAKSAPAPEILINLLAESNSHIFSSEDKQQNIRLKRNVLLAESDYTQLPDAPFTEIEKNAWASYRQQLRDITKQSGFPDDVIFPMSPKNEPR